MTYISGAALVWTAVFVLLGAVRGVWKSLAAIVGFGAALASLSLVAPVTDLVVHQWPTLASQRTLILWVCGVLTFLLSGLLARLAVQSLERPLPLKGKGFNRSGGALLGGLYGATLGVFLVWGAALLVETWPVEFTDDREARGASPTPAVVQFSRQVVAEVVAWNMTRTGADPDAVQWGKAVAEQPATVLRGVQETVQSPAFQALLDNDEVLELVEQRDPEGLRTSPAFQEFLDQPSAQQLRSLLGTDGEALSEERIADQLVRVLHNIDRVRNDPEVEALFEDPEVQSFVREQGPLTPGLYPKAQRLLQRVLSIESHASEQPVAPVKASREELKYESHLLVN